MKDFILFYLLSIFFIYNSNAQIGLQQNIIIDESYGVIQSNSVISADIDGDGLKDIISAGRNEVAWFKNLGNEKFSTENDIYEEIALMFDVKVGDMDGDNDNDVILFLRLSDEKQLVWLENNDGLGTFNPPQTLITYSLFTNTVFEITDFDNDNDIDILSADVNSISYFQNDNGVFSMSSLLSSSHLNNGIQDFITLDVDGDNLKDIIIDAYDLMAFKQEPDGSMTLLENMDGYVQSEFISGGDIDNDGDNDITIFFESGGSDRKIKLFENTDGLGTFADAVSLVSLDNAGELSNAFTNSIRLIDVNADNFLDMVVHQRSLETLSVFINQGNSNFSTEVIIANDFANLNSIYIDDINNDFFPDIITASVGDGQISWFKNIDGLGNYSNKNLISKYAYWINHVNAGDLDGDGDLDIVSSSHADNKLAWYANSNGLGDFSEQQNIISNSIPKPKDAFIVDINGDGHNDVLCISYLDDFPEDSYSVIWFQNDGNGNFAQENIIDSVPEQVVRIQYADIDNDNDFDVISAEEDSILKLYKNNGNGTFETPIIFSEQGSGYPRCLKVGDVDNDNDVDILISYGGGEIAWYENLDGLGDLTSKNIIIPQVSSPKSFSLKDFNGDGFKDIVFCNFVNDDIIYSLNTDGLGNFGSEQIISTTLLDTEAVYAIDIDQDGDNDVITSSQNSSKLVWFENDGMANFSSPIEITANAARINHITSADFNSDGRPDLLTSSYDDDQIAWYDNLGTFTNTLSGQVKLDANADGCDDTDTGIPNVLITTDNGTNSFATFTQTDGKYSFLADQQVFTTSISSALPNYFISNPLNHTDDFTTLSGSTIESDFCVEASQAINDLNVVIYPDLNEPRPGFDTSYKLVYSNSGTTPLSGDLTFIFDNAKIQFLNASEPVASQTANALTFDYANLNPFETRTIDLNFNVFPPPTTNIDDELISTVNISPSASDETQNDNTFTLEQTVIGSYDPNDIQILEGDQVHIDDSDEYLHFLIRFQNTGTASAINVRVEHILDSNLDWTTMQLQSLSHDGRVEITDGSDVQFIFNNINLPDQTSDEEGSIGYIAFKIKPKADVILGDIISGVADIYFDFNPPIITNTATTEFVENLSNEEFEFNEILIYPNPTNGLLNLKSKNIIDDVQVFDITGRKLIDYKSKSNQTEIDLSTFQKGIYLLKIYSVNSVLTKKIIKN